MWYRLVAEWRDGGDQCPVSSRWPGTWPVRRLGLPFLLNSQFIGSAVRSLFSTHFAHCLPQILFQLLEPGSRRGRYGDHPPGIIQFESRQRGSRRQEIALRKHHDVGLLEQGIAVEPDL